MEKTLIQHSAYLVDQLRQVGPDAVLCGLLAEWPLAVVGEQIIGLRKSPFPSLVAKGCKGVLEDISSELATVEDDGSLGKDVANAAADLLLSTTISDRMSCHIEEEKIALLSAEDALIDKSLCKSFSNLLELVSDLHQVPGLSCSGKKKKSCDAHLLALLHHLEGLVKKNLAGKSVVYDLDVAVCEGESASRSILLHCDATSEGQLDDNASSQSLVSGPLSLALGVLVLGAVPLLESPSAAGPAPPRRRVNPEDISNK
ncbi:hypothetical protein HG530_015582 [Fusarium avenaceum]|nr:hypothetical protein HG530_015582 [Fusarium avenaceum]